MSDFRKRMRRHLLAAGAFGAPLAAERHYLPFVAASSDWAHADLLLFFVRFRCSAPT